MPLDALEQSICDTLGARAGAIREDLARHVAIPTGGGHVPGIEAYRGLLVERLEALGATTRLEPGDEVPAWLDPDGGEPPTPKPVLVAEGPVRGGPRILLAGHLDTVHDPKGPFQTMTIDADGAVATGPGTADMKGGILVAIAALEALAEAGVEVVWTVLLNGDEETGSLGSRRIIRAVAAEHDVGLAMEPALPGGDLVVERVGSGQFMVTVHGRAAHAGRDFTAGVSAVTCLGTVLAALDAMSDPSSGRIVNVGPLRGGAVTNTVPDFAACWGNARFADAAAAEALGRAIDDLATAEDAMPRISVERCWTRPAKPRTPGVTALAEAALAVAEALGEPLPFAHSGGVCDGNLMQDAGLPTLDSMGVRGGNLHRDDEFVELDSLVARSRLLALLMHRVAGGRVELPTGDAPVAGNGGGP